MMSVVVMYVVVVPMMALMVASKNEMTKNGGMTTRTGQPLLGQGPKKRENTTATPEMIHTSKVSR